MKDWRLAYINRILSSYTHEVRNYLAIIKETNGLMKDVIQIGKSGAVEARQFLGFIGCVEDQVARATAITDYLHRFSHRMDCEHATVNVNELIEELVALMTRIAYRKRIALEMDLRGGLPDIVIGPMQLNYIMSCLIDDKLARLDRNSAIRISTSFLNGRICITMASKGEVVQTGAPESCGDAEITGLAVEIGAEISRNGEEIVISLPVSSRGKDGKV